MVDSHCLIEGVTESGRRFRPSDWVERFASMHARFGKNRRLNFSTELRPVVFDGGKALMVARSLQTSAPEVWEQIMSFARNNELRIHEIVESEGEDIEVVKKAGSLPDPGLLNVI